MLNQKTKKSIQFKLKNLNQRKNFQSIINYLQLKIALNKASI